jgi:hypothetical protein
MEGLGAGAGAAFLGATGLEGRGLGTDLDGRDDSSAVPPPRPNKEMEGLGAGEGATFLGAGLEGRGCGTDLDGRDDSSAGPPPSPNNDIVARGDGAGAAFFGMGLEGLGFGIGFDARGCGTGLDGRDDSSAGPPRPNKEMEGLGAGAGDDASAVLSKKYLIEMEVRTCKMTDFVVTYSTKTYCFFVLTWNRTTSEPRYHRRLSLESVTS